MKKVWILATIFMAAHVCAEGAVTARAAVQRGQSVPVSSGTNSSGAAQIPGRAGASGAIKNSGAAGTGQGASNQSNGAAGTSAINQGNAAAGSNSANRNAGRAGSPNGGAGASGSNAIKSGPAKPGTTSARAASLGASKILMAATAKIAESKAPAIEGDPCKEAYWACMDTFCINDNGNGMRCACSNDSIRLDKEYETAVLEIEAKLNQSADIAEQLEHGSTFRAVRSGDAFGEDMAPECEDDDIACKIGAAKFSAAALLCDERVAEECKANHAFTRLQYSQNIRNDCNAYTLAIKDVKEKGVIAAANARREMKEVAIEQFETQNKYNESECGIELRKCMNRAEVCGTDWSRCANGVESFRYHCENKVLDQCQAVRETVWAGFVTDIAPELTKVALDAEQTDRNGCLNRISDCIVGACRDNLTGEGETMDACLARPEMARSFCKIELDECDANGNLWTYVKAKLAALRVDRCTDEVKACFTRDEACGSDYSKCIGLDFDAMHNMCPVDKLVVCKAEKKDFAISDVDDMLTGIFLAMDNQLMDKCQTIAEEKMAEVCGSAHTCDGPFSEYNAGDLGGEVNWASVPISDGREWTACLDRNEGGCAEYPKAGTLLISQYLQDAGAAGDEAEKIKASLESANKRIGAVIGLLEEDPKVSWCTGGRNLGQISGENTQTMGRFPTLTQGFMRIIAEAGLKRLGAVEN